jgi:hypothetical protein
MSKRHLFADVRKALNANGIAKPHDLKKGFALHCSRPLATR